AWDGGELERRLRDEAFRPFDLEHGPLVRAALFTGVRGGDVLVVAIHHLAADFASFGVLARELGTLAAGGSLGSPPPPMSEAVRRQAAALAGPRGDAACEWWCRRLAGVPPLDLPTDRPRPALPSFRGGARTAFLPAALLAELARGSQATPFMAALAVFTALLARTSGQEDFLVGTPLSQRSAEGLGRHEETANRFSGTVGYLVNPVALRADVAGEPTAAELVDRARRSTLEAFAHQEVPLQLLAERLLPERGGGGPPLLQAMLVLHRAPAPELQALGAFALGLGGARLRLGGLELEALPLEHPGAQFDLTLQAAELDGCLAVSLGFHSDLFDPASATRLLGHAANLARAMAAAPSRPVWELDLLAETERRQLLAWNATAVARGDEAATLHGLFELQAERTPRAPAVVAAAGIVTYGELNRRANQLAWRLRRLGIGPEARVGVLLDRTPDLLVGLLGVLKAGGAYVPLDPAYPRERLLLMASDAGLSALVTLDALAGLAGPGPRPVRLDAEREALDAEPDGNPGPPILPQNLAYVIYTSGSTGRPKGVAIEHRSPVELVAWARGEFSHEELGGVLAATSVCFDLSVFEIFVPLACGGRVILAGNVLELPSLAAAGAVSLLNTVPSAMAELALGELPPGLVAVNLAGEPLPPRLAERLRDHPQVRRLRNLYGPTEDTTYSTGETIAADAARITIGRPLANTRVHLLDRRLRPLPVGVAGELCLAGAGLARGYLGRPELTAERFIPDPCDGGGGRLYRTGDLARRLADGRLEFLGRIDQQVKVRGFRVEPGEIEAALAVHPAVREVSVVVREDLPGGRGLAAYVVPAAGQAVEPATLQSLRSLLQGKLPAHLVPDRFMALERLPRTPSGKVDRRALPAPAAVPAGVRVPPRTPVEEIVAAAWAELLGCEVGAHDDFFALGGHSLLAARAVARLRTALDVELPLPALFGRPTVAGLAAVVEGLRGGGAGAAAPVPALRRLARPARQVGTAGQAGTAPAEGTAQGADGLDVAAGASVAAATDAGEVYPLSFAQERLWFLERLAPGLAVYNVPAAVRLTGRLDAAALRRSLAGIVGRHEALRTTYATDADGETAGYAPVQVEVGAPVQVVAAPGSATAAAAAALPVVDLAGLASPAVATEARGLAAAEALGLRLAAAEARRPFDLERGPVLRSLLVRLSPEEH
ncbi:MAG: amino acid adenylation domain-containing protein, partial [Acidobacteria bacterium]|nr:amino acid adenylation domain-containing protein [Acidobacteriota bacterium]